MSEIGREKCASEAASPSGRIAAADFRQEAPPSYTWHLIYEISYNVFLTIMLR